MFEHNYPTASLTRRLAAMAYDGLVLLACYIFVGFILVGISAAFHGGEPPGAFSAAANMSLMFCISFFYYSHSWRRGGQTIGMKAWRIRIVNENGDKPLQVSQCMLRTAVGFFSLLAAGLGFWWMLFDTRQRTWHDIASVTRIVYIPYK
ncbi:RDD family protein [Parathalassolituus penaei]|uniref:RDD family protein n=1 Tax=Parathalassolituus penaei TaxID=2997323 RepID=A0A9X3IRV4_9GAMM|nr:RDD family protein [Parathalassolituus penaei]MCY0964625.1 RDD family protein [Parathalassolituus penaei]